MKIGKKFILIRTPNFFISIFDGSDGIEVFQINWKGDTNDIWNLIKL